MKCHACEYFVSPDHCWVDPKTVDPCPQAHICDRFEYEASYGEIAQLEREKERARCAEICADIAGEVDWQARGIMQMDAEQVGIECACRIRGEK